MNKVLYHWFCLLQDEEQYHNVREVFYLDNKTIQYRSNDIDGQSRWYNDSIADFEFKFKVNIGELISKDTQVRADEIIDQEYLDNLGSDLQ